MRTLRLTFQAFGPYREKQDLDFTRLGDEGLFLVTGPTGAGKTTIFDAITYSLYGKASGVDREQDTLRSDFSDPSQPTFVHFTFSVKDKTYRVEREPKQQLPKERGEGFKDSPAKASLYLVDEAGDDLLASKINETNASIQDIIGLDYDQFLKMIMIPQGEFRKLISENSTDREQILQKIFQTYQYRDLQDALKEKTVVHKEKLNASLIQRDQAWSQVPFDEDFMLDEQTEEQKRQSLSNLLMARKEEQRLVLKDKEEKEQSIKESEERLKEATTLAEAFERKKVLMETVETQRKQQPIIDRKIVERDQAEQAQRIEPLYEHMLERKDEVDSINNRYMKEQDALKEITNHYDGQMERVDNLLEAKAAKEQARILLDKDKEVIITWSRYIDKKQAYEAQERHLDTIQQEVTQHEESLKTFKINLQQNQAEQERLGQAKTEQIEKKHVISALDKDIQQLSECKDDLQKLDALIKQYKVLNQRLVGLEKEVQEIEALKTTQNEMWRANYSHQLAKTLIEGEPCPVCGSHEHPHPETAEGELITEDMLRRTDKTLQTLNADYQRLKTKQTTEKVKGTEKREQINRVLTDLGLDPKQVNTEEALTPVINQRETERNTQKQQLYNLTQSVERLEKLKLEENQLKLDEEKATLAVTEKLTRRDEATHQVHETKGALEQLKAHVPNTTLTIDAYKDEVIKKEADLSTWFKVLEQEQRKFEEMKDQKSRLEASIAHSANQLREVEAKLNQAQERFNHVLTDSDFKDQASFLSARLTQVEVQALKETINAHQKGHDQTMQALEEVHTLVANQTMPDLAHLNAHHQELKLSYQALTEKGVHVARDLEQLQTVETRIHAIDQDIKKKETLYYDYDHLSKIASGHNHLKLSFERYVLSSFLDDIIQKANLRLYELTDQRYQLKRSETVAKRGAQSGLDLEVIDYHTGKTRSVKTLSGGEGFKASLSLALGMADVVQAYAGGIQLDTLFIDEGFGTLDELSLEQAIHTLKGLKQKNRILGIISHVPQLKAEIYAKLEIDTSPKGSTAQFNL